MEYFIAMPLSFTYVIIESNMLNTPKNDNTRLNVRSGERFGHFFLSPYHYSLQFHLTWTFFISWEKVMLYMRAIYLKQNRMYILNLPRYNNELWNAQSRERLVQFSTLWQNAIKQVYSTNSQLWYISFSSWIQFRLSWNKIAFSMLAWECGWDAINLKCSSCSESETLL